MKTVFQRVAAIIFLLPLFSILNLGLAAGSPASLSGDYRLHFEQTSKSCGAKISPVDVNVTFNFSDTNVTMSFPGGFLGIDFLDAKFDPRTGTVTDHLQQLVSLGATEATIALDIKGNVVSEGTNTEIHFEVSFDKTADDSAWNCKVTGEGHATKL